MRLGDVDGVSPSSSSSRGATAVVGRLLHPRLSVRGTLSLPRDTLHEACASEGLREALNASVGEWIHVSSLGGPSAGASGSWSLRLVEAGEDAVVCSPANRSSTDCSLMLYLPAGIIENLEATPGRSSVRVIRESVLSPPLPASRVVISRVTMPSSKRHVRSALRSFFAVPRVLRKGELVGFSRCTPWCLLEVEAGPAAVRDNDSSDDSSQSSGSEGIRPGALRARARLPLGAHQEPVDPLVGLAFEELLFFRVEVIEDTSTAKDSRGSQCYLVDSRCTEVVLQGTCSARALPYLAGHLFCAPPLTLPAPVDEPYKRLLGLLAPTVRAWARGGTEKSPLSPPPVLVAGPRGCCKRLLLRAVCERLGLHLMEVSCQLLAQGPSGPEESLQRLIAQASEKSPVVLCLRRLQALTVGGPSLSPAALQLSRRRVEMNLSGALGAARSAVGVGARRPLVVLAGSCEDPEDLGGPLRRLFQVELQVLRPSEADRELLARRLLGSEDPELPGVVAKLTAGLSYAELRAVCAEVVCRQRERCPPGPTSDDAEHAEKAVKRLRGGSQVAISLSTKVQWADVGGLQDAKEEVMNCITLPLAQGHLLAGQKLRSGILLFGPPGTGKTLLAKAVATECRTNFLSVKGPELLSMYIGESERNVRELFRQGRELQPCVLFFDELDSLVPARGRGSDSGGVMDRMVSQLTTELDALPSTVFLIGATNRPDLLDRSLLRPGRLDRMVYLGIAKDRLPVLRACTRKFELEDLPRQDGGVAGDALLQAVAKACPFNLTGADVAVLCSDAYELAQKEHIALLDDVAAKARISVNTLLLFLEAWEESKSAIEQTASSGNEPCKFILLHPTRQTLTSNECALKDAPAGLALYQCRHQRGTFLLVHHAPRSSHSPGATEGSVASSTGAVVVLHHGAAQSDPSSAAEAWSDAPVSDSPQGCGHCHRWAVAARGPDTSAVVRGFCPMSALHVRVGWRHFQEALCQLQPSVPAEDLKRYEQLAREYQNTKK